MAVSNAIAAVKFVPLRNSDRASATDAYEHDEDAAPSPAATVSVRGESSGSSRPIDSFGTNACTTADREKTRISAHMISQAIDLAIRSIWSTACMSANPSRLLVTYRSCYPIFLYPSTIQSAMTAA